MTAAQPQPPVITSLSCSGGYSSGSAGNNNYYSHVCGPLSGFSVGVTVTVTNSIGSTGATSYPFCQR